MMLRCLICYSAVLLGGAAWSQPVYVSDVSGRGVTEEELATMTDLLKMSVQGANGYSLAEDQESAQIILRGNLLLVGNRYLLGVNKTQKNGKRYYAEMKMANLDEADTVARRLVQAVLAERSPTHNITVEDVTQQEERQGTRRLQPVSQWQFGFGPAWGSNLNAAGVGSNWSLGYSWGLSSQFDLTLVYDIYFAREEADSRFGNLSVGVNYYFTQMNHSPFATADLGYGTAGASDGCEDGWFFCKVDTRDEAGGWVVGGGVGYKFFSSVGCQLGTCASL